MKNTSLWLGKKQGHKYFSFVLTSFFRIKNMYIKTSPTWKGLLVLPIQAA